MTTTAWMVPARELKPGQVGISSRGEIIRKVGPMQRLERLDARGCRYTLPDDDSTYLFIGWL